MLHHRLFLRVGTLLCLACLVAPFSAPRHISAQDQPTPVPPSISSPPAFRQVLSDADFQLRSRIIKTKIYSLPALKASTLPTRGQFVISEHAVKLNLLPGDLLIETNAGPLQATYQELDDLKDLRQVKVFRPDQNKTFSVDITASDLPQVTPYTDLTLSFVRATKDAPAWAPLVVLALQACQIDPDLAESAFARAVTQGYQPDALAFAAGARLASAQGRKDAVIAYLAALATATPPHGEIITREERIFLAMSVAAFPTALQACDLSPAQGDWILLTKKIIQAAINQKQDKLPSQVMDQFKRVSTARSAGQFQSPAPGSFSERNFSIDSTKGRNAVIDEINPANPVIIQASPIVFDMEPKGGLNEVEIRIRVRMTPDKEKHTHSLGMIFFDAANLVKTRTQRPQAQWEGDGRIAEFFIRSDHGASSVISRLAISDIDKLDLQTNTEMFRIDPSEVHELRFISANGLFQGLIDDKPVTCLPNLSKQIPLGCAIQAENMKIQVLKFDVIELIRKVPDNAAQAPPGPPASCRHLHG